MVSSSLSRVGVPPAQPHPPLGPEPLGQRGHRLGHPLAARRRDRPGGAPEPGPLGRRLPASQRHDLGPELGDEAGQVGAALLGTRRAVGAGGAAHPGPLHQPAEQPLPLALQEPYALGQILGAGLGVGAGAAIRGRGVRQLDLPAPRLGGVAPGPLGRGSGCFQLRLELGHPALEEDDLLQRAPEDSLRVEHATAALHPVHHSTPPWPAACPIPARLGIPS